MRGVSVPLSFARPGDVVDEEGWGRFVVITHVWQEENGDWRVLYLNAAGLKDYWKCLAGTTPTLYARVGQGCWPPPKGCASSFLTGASHNQPVFR